MKLQNIRLAVDAIIFGFSEGNLYVLLIRQKFGTNKLQWALPGGLVQNEETLNEAVLRELAEETGVKINYLEQLYTFGDKIDRDHRNRVVSVAYFGLVDSSKIIVKPDTDALHAEWIALDKIPKLAFDHNQMVKLAFQRLQNKLTYQPIGFDLLPKEFQFSELENLYCTILHREIDRRNFRKKILSFGIIEETDKILLKGAGRPSRLFRFNKKKYRELEKEGIIFEI